MDKAVQALQLQFQQGFPPSRDAVFWALQTCAATKNLQDCRYLHAIIAGTALNDVVSDYLIRLFASCGSLLEANLVFCNVSEPSDFTWNAIMSAHARHGENQRTLELFFEMQQEGFGANRFVVPCILKACGGLGGLQHGRLVHDQIIRHNITSDTVIGNALVDLYFKCGSLGEAQRVFDNLSGRNLVSWGILVSGYAYAGDVPFALNLFESMERDHVLPDKTMYLCILKACASVCAAKQGRVIHKHIIQRGMDSDVVLGSSLVDMYAKCGILGEGCKVFENLSNADVAVWGAMIAGYAQHEQGLTALKLFEQMQQKCIMPDKPTFLSTLKACGSLQAVKMGEVVYDQIIVCDFHSDLEVGTGIIDMYVKCGNLDEAHNIFNRLPNVDVVSWGAVIAGTVQHGDAFTALELFDEMLQKGIEPSEVTYLFVLKACTSIGAITQGKVVHDLITQNEIVLGVQIISALIDMYGSCAYLQEAHKMFSFVPIKDVVVWNVMFLGYSQQGEVLSALQLFFKMQQEGVEPDQNTFSSILKACTVREAINQGMSMHDQVVRRGLESEPVVGNSLVDMYCKCGYVDDGVQVFQMLPCKDVVTWNSIMGGYVLHQQPHMALQYYEKMLHDGCLPDKVAFSCALEASKCTESINHGRLLHHQSIECELEADVAIGSSLVGLYSSCGSLDEARQTFTKSLKKDLVLWDRIIAACTQHGNCKLALQYFDEMQQQGLKPDGTTYTSVLASCSHGGLAEKGFEAVKEAYCSSLSIEHFSCMVDLLGRAGCLNEAKEILDSMPLIPDMTGWICLLTACKTFGNVDLGRHCFDKVVASDPSITSAYTLMSNIYVNAEMWEDAYKIEEMRSFSSAWKKPGKASIAVEDHMQDFVVNDHLYTDNTYTKSQRVSRLLRKEGYMPQVESSSALFLQNEVDIRRFRQNESVELGFGVLSGVDAITSRCIFLWSGLTDFEFLPNVRIENLVLKGACWEFKHKDELCFSG